MPARSSSNCLVWTIRVLFRLVRAVLGVLFLIFSAIQQVNELSTFDEICKPTTSLENHVDDDEDDMALMDNVLAMRNRHDRSSSFQGMNETIPLHHRSLEFMTNSQPFITEEEEETLPSDVAFIRSENLLSTTRAVQRMNRKNSEIIEKEIENLKHSLSKFTFP